MHLTPTILYIGLAVVFVFLMGLQLERIEKRLGRVIDLLLNLPDVRKSILQDIETEKLIKADQQKRRKSFWDRLLQR